jgi:hypothetical protein
VPVDDETLSEITELEQQFAACYNAGDTPRLLATLSDQALVTAMGDLAGGGLEEIFSATPTPLNADEMIVLFPLRDARLLPDGRVGVIVDWGTSAEPDQVSESNFRIYRQVEGSWVIDEEIPILN